MCPMMAIKMWVKRKNRKSLCSLRLGNRPSNLGKQASTFPDHALDYFARVQVCDLQMIMTQPLRSAVSGPVMVKEPL